MKLKRSFFAVLLAILTMFFSSNCMAYKYPWINVAVVGDDDLKKHFMELLNRKYSDDSTGSWVTGGILHFPSVSDDQGFAHFEMTFRNIDLPDRDLSRQISFLGRGRFRSVVVVSDIERFDKGSYLGDFDKRKSEFVEEIKQLCIAIKQSNPDIQLFILLVSKDNGQAATHERLVHNLRGYLEPMFRRASSGIRPCPYQCFGSLFCTDDSMKETVGRVVNQLITFEHMRPDRIYEESCRNIAIGFVVAGLIVAGVCIIVCLCLGSDGGASDSSTSNHTAT